MRTPNRTDTPRCQVLPFRPQVLLAQSKEPIIYVMEHYLASKGYEVRVARNEFEVLLEAARGGLSAAIVDPGLPSLEGASYVGELRRRCPQMPILEFPVDRERAGALKETKTPLFEEVLASFTCGAHVNEADANVITVVSAVG